MALKGLQPQSAYRDRGLPAEDTGRGHRNPGMRSFQQPGGATSRNSNYKSSVGPQGHAPAQTTKPSYEIPALVICHSRSAPTSNYTRLSNRTLCLAPLLPVYPSLGVSCQRSHGEWGKISERANGRKSQANWKDLESHERKITCTLLAPAHIPNNSFGGDEKNCGVHQITAEIPLTPYPGHLSCFLLFGRELCQGSHICHFRRNRKGFQDLL